MVQKVQGWALLSDYWKTFSVNPAVNGYFFESWKIRQRKERDGLRLSLAVLMIQWDSTPHCP